MLRVLLCKALVGWSVILFAKGSLDFLFPWASSHKWFASVFAYSYFSCLLTFIFLKVAWTGQGVEEACGRNHYKSGMLAIFSVK